MYLQKIEIAGFKSFAKKTTLDFSSGISAIVGPNGSGKSNIADAIRWVLGEQSMKNLRGKKSEDIIFAGTKNKGRLGYAEVSLYLNNEDKSLPLDYKEIVITRKIFRDGEGEYRINKNKVRKIDIDQLLAQAGFGQKTYSVIGQGMIDSILKSSPKELKELFYDACGVRAFDIKKNIAENKLKKTQENISRGNDLIGEIEPHLRALKRQVGRVEKKEKLLKERDAIFDVYYSHTYNQSRTAEKELQQKIEKLEKQDLKISKVIEENEVKLAEFKKISDNSEKKQLATEVQKLHAQKRSLEQQVFIAKGKIEIEQEKAKAAGKNQEKQQIIQLQKSIKENTKHQEKIQQQIKDSKKQQLQLIKKADILQQKITEIDTQIEKEEGAIKNISLAGIQKDLKKTTNEFASILRNIFASKNIAEVREMKVRAGVKHEKLIEIYKQIEKKATGKVDTKKLTALQHAKKQGLEAASINNEQLQKTKVQSAVLQNQFDTKKTEVKKWKDKIEHLQKKLAEPKKDIYQKNIQELQKKVAMSAIKLKTVITELKEKTPKLQKLEDKENQIKKDFFEIENKYRSSVKKQSGVRDEIRSLEIKNAECISKKEATIDELIEQIGHSNMVKKVAQYMKKPQKISEQEATHYKKELHVIQSKLAGIGDIDTETMQEYTETAKRYEFLVQQKEDLTQAEKKLIKVIAKLNKEIQSQFNDSFTNISEHFKKYFKTLFNGGKADLKRVTVTEGEGEDAEKKEIIQIDVNPPGKKLQNISMLSGGERALTSIALLMAIIENNPPPFIALDEVDAALDEANSERFSKILLDAAKKSQVLAITHNRATMNEASRLFGVTMEESGISKTLSIKLEEAKKIQEKKVIKGIVQKNVVTTETAAVQ